VSAGIGIGNEDLHAHTTMSDGDLSLEEVVRLAEERGVRIGIADHVSTRNVARFVATRSAVERYLDALEREDVYRSAEFCWCDTLWAELPGELMRRFDYRIGSNHGFWLPDGTLGSPWWQRLPAPWHERPDELVEIMVRNLCDLVDAMPIEIVAHATMLPPGLLDLDPSPEAWWTEEREDRFVEALRRSGVALEISNRYRLPHERILVKAREAGVSFALGSDGHTERQIARLEWSLATADRVGITERHLFTPGAAHRVAT
jgi:histidinol phosphatase-like PHP family hydrolase